MILGIRYSRYESLNFLDSETLINPENFQKKVPIFGGFPVQKIQKNCGNSSNFFPGFCVLILKSGPESRFSGLEFSRFRIPELQDFPGFPVP